MRLPFQRSPGLRVSVGASILSGFPAEAERLSASTN